VVRWVTLLHHFHSICWWEKLNIGKHLATLRTRVYSVLLFDSQCSDVLPAGSQEISFSRCPLVFNVVSEGPMLCVLASSFKLVDDRWSHAPVGRSDRQRRRYSADACRRYHGRRSSPSSLERMMAGVRKQNLQWGRWKRGTGKRRTGKRGNIMCMGSEM